MDVWDLFAFGQQQRNRFQLIRALARICSLALGLLTEQNKCAHARSPSLFTAIPLSIHRLLILHWSANCIRYGTHIECNSAIAMCYCLNRYSPGIDRCNSGTHYFVCFNCSKNRAEPSSSRNNKQKITNLITFNIISLWIAQWARLFDEANKIKMYSEENGKKYAGAQSTHCELLQNAWDNTHKKRHTTKASIKKCTSNFFPAIGVKKNSKWEKKSITKEKIVL